MYSNNLFFEFSPFPAQSNSVFNMLPGRPYGHLPIYLSTNLYHVLLLKCPIPSKTEKIKLLVNSAILPEC
jgi:hypothetical protein